MKTIAIINDRSELALYVNDDNRLGILHFIGHLGKVIRITTVGRWHIYVDNHWIWADLIQKGD